MTTARIQDKVAKYVETLNQTAKQLTGEDDDDAFDDDVTAAVEQQLASLKEHTGE